DAQTRPWEKSRSIAHGIPACDPSAGRTGTFNCSRNQFCSVHLSFAPKHTKDILMKSAVTRSLVAATLLLFPAVASAQGVPGGIERGSREGERAAGPVGGIVGG